MPPLHNVQAVQNPAVRQQFLESKKAGLVDWLGFAVHSNVPEVMRKAVELGWYDCVLVKYFPGNKAQLDPILAQAQKIGMGIVVMKWRSGGGDRQTALNTVLSHPATSTVLGSCGSVQEVGQWVGMASAALPPDFEERSRRMIAEQERTACAGCGNCRICPRGVAVCDILRYQMYYDVYGEREMGRQGYASLTAWQRATNCDDCGLCERVCGNHLPIRAKLKEAHAALMA